MMYLTLALAWSRFLVQEEEAAFVLGVVASSTSCGEPHIPAGTTTPASGELGSPWSNTQRLQAEACASKGAATLRRNIGRLRPPFRGSKGNITISTWCKHVLETSISPLASFNKYM